MNGKYIYFGTGDEWVVELRCIQIIYKKRVEKFY